MVVIGIAGPSASGKSVLCRSLAEKLPNSRILQQDWYFIDPDQCSDDANFCDLKYLHIEEFISHVEDLTHGKSIQVARMDMQTFRRTEKFDIIEPGEHLLIEGMTIFRIPEVYKSCTYRVYLSPGMPAIHSRKWKRDKTDRGKSEDIIQNQLDWVAREYKYDLATLPEEVFVVDSAINMQQLCNTVLNYVLNDKNSHIV